MRGKFIALNAYIRKEEKSQTDKFLSQELPQKSKISPKQTQERKYSLVLSGLDSIVQHYKYSLTLITCFFLLLLNIAREDHTFSHANFSLHICPQSSQYYWGKSQQCWPESFKPMTILLKWSFDMDNQTYPNSLANLLFHYLSRWF